ncbi:acyltransferase [Amorphoplanes nipponensis]|uniref:Acyltransferase n=1 Tax=Actinoplanes nipponensis TaxID=135950 RepID=A0A919JD65_9ACTN|nr:acyltransferase [Actinoplanes nipponensis]GIE46737.1 acyltransferase [Actinoplanes nipponensis]
MRPAARDRTIDAARAIAICGVVVGHWLVTGLVPGPEGVTVASPLTAMPAAAPVSWLLQTLGLLFFAGGYAAHARGSAAGPAGGRRAGPLGRLLRPAAILLGAWALVLTAGAALGAPATTLRTIATLVVSPLWFLVPYLALHAATAPLRRLVHRIGPAAVLPPLAVVAASDLGLLPGLAALPAAWAIPWLLGMLVARHDRLARAVTGRPGDDGAPHRGAGPWIGVALACNGAAALAVLILVAGYPAGAVGVPGDGRSNLDPPSLAAVALAVTQIGVLLTVRGPLARLLRHDRALRPVAALNRVAVPVYLGHQSVLLAVAGVAALVDPAMPGLLTAPDGAAWAGQRLAWLPVLGLVLAVVTRTRHDGGPDYLRRLLRGTLFDGSRARTTHGGDRCAR